MKTDYNAVYYRKHKEKIRLQAKQWAIQNPEQKRRTAKEYYKNNKDILLRKSRLYAQKNKEKLTAYKINWAKNNPEVNRAYLYKKKYGLSIEQYEKLLIDQNGVCKLCFKPEYRRRLAVDHDHKTGQIRGLLCSRCNRYIVATVENNIEYFKRLREYLNLL